MIQLTSYIGHLTYSWDNGNSYRTTNEIPINPLTFDCPPPVYENPKSGGWTLIAKAIVTNNTKFRKIIKHAKRLKRKEDGNQIF